MKGKGRDKEKTLSREMVSPGRQGIKKAKASKSLMLKDAFALWMHHTPVNSICQHLAQKSFLTLYTLTNAENWNIIPYMSKGVHG